MSQFDDRIDKKVGFKTVHDRKDNSKFSSNNFSRQEVKALLLSERHPYEQEIMLH